MHAPIVTTLLCTALLLGCGQQTPPEATTKATPATTAPGSPPPATRPEDQVGMAAATRDSASNDQIDNPTGRGEHGQAGRGQGPAPGQHGNPTPTGQGADAVTEQQALADCERLTEPHKTECITKVRRGHDADERSSAPPHDDGG